jgi:hypothetical protein
MRAVIDKCTARNPDDRYRYAEQARQALLRVPEAPRGANGQDD